MVSGGARARSGPAPDPNALRRDRKDDKAWINLPAVPLSDVPAFPLPKIPVYYVYYEDKKQVREFDESATEQRWESETSLWSDLWAKPQAHMWAALGLKWQVAAYVRAYLESVGPDSNSGLKTAALRQEAELGLSTPGMNTLRWQIATDELAEHRSEVKPSRQSSRDRLKALNA